jgi:hypothetical protein
MSESTNESTSFIKTCYVLDDQAEMVVSFPASESMAVHILALIFMAILIFTTVCLNGVTAFTIWRSKTLKEKPANFTIMLQSIVDFGNGALVMPLIIFQWASEIAGRPNCLIMYVLKKLGMLFFFYTLTTLSVMNFDRYMGVLHPLVHRTLVTNKRILRYVVAASSIQTVIYAFSLTHNEIIRPILITVTMSFILMTVFVYLKIFLKIHDTNRVRVTLVEEGCESGVENRPRSTVAKKLAKRRVGKASFLKELKAAKSSFLVVICCLVCCLPSALSFGPLNLKSSFTAIAIKIFFVVLAMLNSTLNSVIYFWLNNMLRKQGKDVIKRMFSRSTAT